MGGLLPLHQRSQLCPRPPGTREPRGWSVNFEGGVRVQDPGRQVVTKEAVDHGAVVEARGDVGGDFSQVADFEAGGAVPLPVSHTERRGVVLRTERHCDAPGARLGRLPRGQAKGRPELEEVAGDPNEGQAGREQVPETPVEAELHEPKPEAEGDARRPQKTAASEDALVLRTIEATLAALRVTSGAPPQ